MPPTNRKRPPEGFYSSREAVNVLGVPTSSFYKMVKDGTIKGTVLPGRKEAIYPKSEIDRYARAIRTHLEKFTNDTYSFGIALKEDIPEIRALIADNTPCIVPPLPETIMEAWLRRNPESVHVLRRGGEIVGFVAMLPLPLNTIMGRMRREYTHRTIPVDDIEPYVPGKPIRLYVADAVVNLSENQHSRLGMRLVLELIRFLHRLGEQGVELVEIYTVAVSKFGTRLCTTLGMTPLEEGRTETRTPYKLEIATSTAPQIVEYRHLLQARQLVREQ